MEWKWSSCDEARAKNAGKVKVLELDLKKAYLCCKGSSGDIYEASLKECTCKDFWMNNKGNSPCKHMIRLAIEMGIVNKEGRTPEQEREYQRKKDTEVITRAYGYYYLFNDPVIPDSEYDAIKKRLGL